MPPHQMARFQGGPNSISPYQHPFPSHTQGHPSAHPPALGGTPSYLNPSSQLGPFGGNGALGLQSGLGGGGFGLGGGIGGAGADTGLGSQAARMSFAHGAHIQQHHPQQHHQQAHGMGDHQSRGQAKGRIREVWKHNLHEEMAVLRDLLDRYPYIAMDTEFPGVVSRPMGSFRGKSDYHYQCMRVNVDLLKVIQIGITLFNEDGETPPARPSSTDSIDQPGANGRRGNQGVLPCSWQFNFKFSLKDDMYNQTSIDALVQAGIDFSVLERDGIDPDDFAALLIPSGLLCFENVKWISFHGGYDFGYLTKLVHPVPLPNDESDFDQILRLYFPSTYDVKHLMKHAIKLHNAGMLTPNDPSTAEVLQKFEHRSGLENIAEALKVRRVGAAHQAGSDSLLTGKVFFHIREKVFNGEISDDHVGKVWGLFIPEYQPPTANAGSGGAAGSGSGNTAQHENTPPSHANNAGTNGTNGTPTTPHTNTVGLVSTPAAGSHNTNSMGLGPSPMTPGGGGGVFGSFAFSGNR